MAVQVKLTAYAPDAATAKPACEAAFDRMADLEDILSDWRPRSELNRLCAQAGGPPVPVSPDLFAVLQRALAVAEQTHGAFDPTVGPYVRLWREARKTGKWPAPDDWRKAGELVGWRRVHLYSEERAVQLQVPGMQLDLGGIAKGYILDRALDTLRLAKVPSALIEAGGDIAVGDPPPGRPGWRIRLWDATKDRRWLTASNEGVSTSGDTAQFVVIDGRRYSHIIDPLWGPRYGDPMLATVTAPDATTSDALATAAVVLGEKRSADLIGAMPGITLYVRRAAR
jgi:FAD:protein FMN transferase